MWCKNYSLVLNKSWKKLSGKNTARSLKWPLQRSSLRLFQSNLEAQNGEIMMALVLNRQENSVGL
jgi:hypothetical protein